MSAVNMPLNKQTASCAPFISAMMKMAGHTKKQTQEWRTTFIPERTDELRNEIIRSMSEPMLHRIAPQVSTRDK
jgi:hypothetical protein